ncbi:MAG: trigger factor [Mariniblastus sp.]|nr:trigger factor [Mariniblastus sp.]
MNTDTTNENEVADPQEKKELNLSVDVQEVSACERHVTVSIPREDIERYFEKEFDELVPKAEVPGFRTGRAPRALVENKFRKQISDQVKGTILMDSLSQIGDTQDYSAISEPNLDFDQVNIPEEGDMTYEFDIEVRPEFDMPEWKGLKLERPEHEFTDADIDKHIAKLAVQFADLAPVDDVAQADDYLVCNIVSRHGDSIVSEEKEQSIQVRPTVSFADATLEGFDKLVAGSRSGDTVKATVEVSEFAENEELQGKSVDIEFEILDVKRIEGVASKEVAEKIGIESEEELRKLIGNSMEEQLKYAQREKIRDQISSSLTKSADWELPPDLLRRQSGRELERSVMEMRSSGFSEDEIVSRKNGLRKNILEKTERLLKEHFILEKIAEEQSVEDEPGDYDQEIARIAVQRNDSPRRVRARLERTGQMDALRNMIIERKVVDLITDSAQFTATPYEIDKEGETSALNFFVAGRPKEQIPEAKYDDAEAQPLPTGVKKSDDQ